MRKYRVAYSIALQQVLQRRSTLLMDRLGGVAIVLSLYSFWSALLAGRSEFLGYTGAQMLTYVLAMNVLRSFVFTGRGWELVGDISSGRISSYLARPMDFRGYSLALDLAQKTVHVAAAFLEIGILLAVTGAELYVPGRAEVWLCFAVSAILSSLLFFFIEFMVSSLAFWTSQSGGPLFCFELFVQFAAGAIFPLDVLPSWLQRGLAMTPFPYLVYFPINIYLERVAHSEVLATMGLQAAWLALFVGASSWLWHRGLQSYAAEGG